MIIAKEDAILSSSLAVCSSLADIQGSETLFRFAHWMGTDRGLPVSFHRVYDIVYSHKGPLDQFHSTECMIVYSHKGLLDQFHSTECMIVYSHKGLLDQFHSTECMI